MQIFAPGAAAAAAENHVQLAQAQAAVPVLVGVRRLAGHAAAAAAAAAAVAAVVVDGDDDWQDADACSAYCHEMFAKALWQPLACSR